MDINQRPHRGEIIEPFGFAGAHIDAAMTHWRPKIIMPIGAMYAIVTVKIHCVRNIGEVVAGTRHGGRDVFEINIETTRYGGRLPSAC